MQAASAAPSPVPSANPATTATASAAARAGGSLAVQAPARPNLALSFAPSAPGWWEKDSLSYQLAGGLPAAVVALLVAWVAYQQWRVARAKLNLELFERRLKIFRETEKFLVKSLPGAPPDSTGFVDRLPESSFLFDQEIVSYMQQIMRNRG